MRSQCASALRSSVHLLPTLLFVQLLVAGCECQASPWAGDEVERRPSDDWARVWTPVAEKRYAEKGEEFSCLELESYIANNDPWAAYYAIRDASLFGDDRCEDAIAQNERALRSHTVVVLAVDFYLARESDTEALNRLLERFDVDVVGNAQRSSTDHVIVSLFGFFPDWDRTGRRLLRHLNHADGAAAALVWNALEWKHRLYGQRDGYAQGCAKVAAAEIDAGRVDLTVLCP